MKELHNFIAGPCRLPQEAIDEAVEALKDFDGTGLPIVSVSHRSEQWQAVMDETRGLWKELLDIPDTHEVLFMGGGASMGFLCAAMNYLERKAAYLDTGVWASKALKEAQGIGEAYAIASSADRNYSYIPKGWTCPDDIDYLHITSNNTVYGTEIMEDYDVPVPLVADMSSDILSRPLDVGRYALIYGGAQKNAGPAGVSFAIVRKDTLGKVRRHIPSMLDYRVHIEHQSMFNTPPVFPIYLMNRNLHWLKRQGGVAEMHRRSIVKAGILYDEIDRNAMFRGTAVPEDRSLMNVCFVMAPGYEDLHRDFVDFASDCGMVGIEGHRYAGGFRVSIYNACRIEDVQALTECMREFGRRNG